MSNLTINERLKDVAIPRQNEDFYSNIKKFFGEIIKFEPKILDQLDIMKKNVFLEEESFDFIGSTENKETLSLDKKNYQETTPDNFHVEPYNAVTVTKVNEIKNHKLLNKTIKYKSNKKEETLLFEKSNNNILVFKNSKKNLFLEIKCVNGKLIDFGFCKNNFLYILYESENQLCLMKTHKTYNFFTEHNDNFSVLDLLNCEYFYNIKNIVYKENITEKKYINFNYTNGVFGTINDGQIKGQWKRYKIHELINTKINANVNVSKCTSSLTLLKELSDKMKKFPFRIIGNFKTSDFSTSVFNILINTGSNIISQSTHKGYNDGINAVMFFGNLTNYGIDSNIIIENDIGAEVFYAIDFYEYEEKEYDKSYAENYFNYKVFQTNGFVNNLLFLKPGYRTNVWVCCLGEWNNEMPPSTYFVFGKQIINNQQINELNKVQKLSFNKNGDRMDSYGFNYGVYNYWFGYKIQYIDEVTNEEAIEYLFQEVKLADTTEEQIDIRNSNLISDSKNNIFLINKTNKYKVNPIKKYYCYKDGVYFYNKTKETNRYFYYNENFKQIEHLFLYELIKMFGLENFKTKNLCNDTKYLSKISSENNSEIKNLFKFKFDNTLNGVINFFDFSETKSNLHININNGKFICKGNFFNGFFNDANYQHANYKITIKILEQVKTKYEQIKFQVLFSKLNNEGIYNVIDSKTLLSCKSFDGLMRSLFYSNLEFYFYNFQYSENETFDIILNYKNQPEIKFLETETYVENKIIPGIQDIKYKVHNPKGIVINNKKLNDNLDFKIEGDNLLFKNIELSTANKINSKLNQDNFKIPLIINGKATNTLKTLNKSESFYVEYEKLLEFDSEEIKTQIEDDKEIILILDN